MMAGKPKWWCRRKAFTAYAGREDHGSGLTPLKSSFH